MENLNYLLKTGLGKVPESPNKLDPVTYCCHGLTSYFEELRSQMRNVLEASWTALISCLPTLLRLLSPFFLISLISLELDILQRNLNTMQHCLIYFISFDGKFDCEVLIINIF